MFKSSIFYDVDVFLISLLRRSHRVNGKCNEKMKNKTYKNLGSQKLNTK